MRDGPAELALIARLAGEGEELNVVVRNAAVGATEYHDALVPFAEPRCGGVPLPRRRGSGGAHRR